MIISQFERSLPVRFCFIRLLIGLLLFVFSGGRALAQVNLPKDQADKIQSILEGAAGKSADEQIKALVEVSNQLSSISTGPDELAEAAAVLDFERDRLEVFSENWDGLLDRIKNIENPSTRAQTLRELRESLLRPATQALDHISQNGITGEEAESLVKLVRAVSKAFDDVRDARPFPERGTLDGSSSALSRFLGKAKGVLEVWQASKDPDAKKLISAFRDILGSIQQKAFGVSQVSPIKALDIPLAVAGSIVGTTAEVTKNVSKSLNLLADAIDRGDERSIGLLSESLQNVERSARNYGRNMFDAMADRLIAKLPLIRTVKDWVSGSEPEYCEVRKTDTFSPRGTRGPTSYIKCFWIDAFGNSVKPPHAGEGRGDTQFSKVKLHPGAVEPSGRYGGTKGCGYIWSGTWAITWKIGFPPVKCSSLTFEPFTSYEVTIRATSYGKLTLTTPEGSDKYRASFTILTSAGELVTSIRSNPPVYDKNGVVLSAGSYRIVYGNAPYFYGKPVPPALKNFEYEVVVQSGEVAEVVLPSLRCPSRNAGCTRER